MLTEDLWSRGGNIEMESSLMGTESQKYDNECFEKRVFVKGHKQLYVDNINM